MNDATVAMPNPNFFAKHLRLMDFGFQIPLNATITEIQVEVRRRRISGGGDVFINHVFLSNHIGSGVQPGEAWGTGYATSSYTGDMAFWDFDPEIWNPSFINSSNFWVDLDIRGASSSVEGGVDVVRVTVFYQTSETGGNSTLIKPNPLVDVEEFLRWRDGVFAGYLFEFTLTQPVEAKQFLEYEIFRPLGGYWLVLADGRISPRFFVPPLETGVPALLNDRNITMLPGVERHPIINQVTYRMDHDGTRFRTELLFLDAPSLQQYGLSGQHIIESKGLKLARGGAALAGRVATRIFRRYAGIDPVSAAPNGGAAIVTASSQYLTLTTEVADSVFLTHPLLPNFETGRRGVTTRIFEVVEKQPHFDRGSLTFRLLDVGWQARKQLARIAPEGTSAWTDASPAERARYMFIADETTQAYSDGTAGRKIF